jgi:flavine halogenase
MLQLLIQANRFLIVVLSAYKQMRAQSIPILHDVNEADFDRAFDLIRPRTYIHHRHSVLRT